MKGEHTQNVPLSVTLATSPAQFPCVDGTDRISCFGSGSCPHFLAAATKRGKICIWDVSKLMKVCFNFEGTNSVTEKKSVVNLGFSFICLGALKV